MSHATQSKPTTEGCSSQDVIAMINGYWKTQAVYCMAKLGLADLLAEGPKGSDALAQATETHPPSLSRLLRGLVSLGLLMQEEDGQFALTPLGAYLRTDIPDSVYMWAIDSAERLWELWGHLLSSVKTGETAAQRICGMEVFTYYAQFPEAATTFNAMMTAITATVSETVVAAYDFSPFRTIVDVGGSHGLLVSAILRTHPTMHGILFDMPHAMEGARQNLAAQGLSQRCEVIAGDFFEAVPGGGDVYILKSIIHDWDDAHSTVILRNCHRAAPDARLLLVERIMPAQVKPSATHQALHQSDLNMLVAHGGRERTEAEFQTLFGEAGFRLTAVIPTTSLYSIIEGVPM